MFSFLKYIMRASSMVFTRLFPKMLLFALLLLGNLVLGQDVLLDSLDRASNDTIRIDLLNQLADHQLDEDPKLAIRYGTRALELAGKISYWPGEAKAYTYLGNAFNKIGQQDKALEYHLKSLAICESMDFKIGVAAIQTNIGNLYYTMEDYEKAGEYYNRSLVIKRALNDSAGIALLLENLAVSYQYRGQLIQALQYFTESLDLYKILDAPASMASTLNGIGTVYFEMNNYRQALDHFEQSLQLAGPSGQQGILSVATYNVGEVYTRQKQYEKAEKYYLEALGLANQMSYVDLAKDIYRDLAAYYAITGSHDKAYHYQLKYGQLKDSIFSETHSARIAEMETRYETEKKEQAIELLSKENRIQELTISSQQIGMFAITGGAILVLSMIAILYVQYKRRQREKIEQQQLKFEQQQSALQLQMNELAQQALRAQMNPHFIYNCLNSIQGLIFEADNDAAIAYLEKFGTLLRQVLNFSGEQLIPLSDELEMLRLYLSLESMNREGKFDFEIRVDPGLDPEDIRFPGMLIQPFVENAIKHGILPKPEKGRVDINISQTPRGLRCTVEDNGIGRQQAEQLKAADHRSKGMAITRERLQLIYGNDPATVNLEDLYDQGGKPCGTKVVIEIPDDDPF